MQTTTREVIAGTAASAAFVGLVATTGLVWWFGLLLAGGVYGGLRLLLPAKPEPEHDEVAPGISRQQLEQVAREVSAMADRFATAADGFPDGATAERIRNIGSISRDMVANFRADPGDLHLAEDFLVLQLPKALRIVERYALLAKQPHLDDAARERLRAAADTIVTIETAFARQYRIFLEQDFRDFQVDQRVFQELLVLDGLAEDDTLPAPTRPQEGERP